MAGVALIVLFLTGGCGPKADPAMVSKVNSFFAAQTDKTYKGAKNFTPVPLAVGQYVTHGNTENNGKRSVTRTAIVGKESGGWILGKLQCERIFRVLQPDADQRHGKYLQPRRH